MLKPISFKVKQWSYFDNEGGDPPSTPPNDGGGSGVDKKYTQADLDRVAATARKSAEKQNQKLITDLENLQKNTRLTTEEKEALQNQLDALKNESLTTEQRLTRDLEGTRKRYEDDTKTLSSERDVWKTNFSALKIENAITTAAVKHEAYSVQQMLAHLAKDSDVVEILDDDGKGTGKFQVLTKFEIIDPKTKKPTIVQLPPEEVVAQMKERASEYGNLFKSGVQQGLGKSPTGNNKTTASGEPDFRTMTPEEYRAWRAENHGKKKSK